VNPYSHLVIASELEGDVQPTHPADYYWGAVVPDARHLAGMRRVQTHLPASQILEFRARYPHLESFLQGYLVHCLADEIDLGLVFSRRLPFSLFKRRLSSRHLVILLELFYLEDHEVQPPLSGTHNELLEGLGLDEGVCARFAQGVGEYVASSDPQVQAEELTRLLGLGGDPQIQRYRAAAHAFQERWLVRKALFLSMRASRIGERIVGATRSALAGA
jgi:hypothetical protein